MSFWTPYRPTPEAPWNLGRVAHLHRRAVFGACWEELQRDLNDDPQNAVTRILEGQCRSAGVPDEFENLASLIGNAAVQAGAADRLQAWWIFRCLASPDPLQERLTLMWHNHFATSNFAVNSLALMKQQNETLRRFATGPFRELFSPMMHDPALLEWLDAPSNRTGMTNENLAREALELFALGAGNFSESDVQEGARALTGWTVRQETFRNVPAAHDAGSKTILGRTGDWSGEDFVDILLEDQACAKRIAWRLVNEFFGEEGVGEPALSELAEGLRTNDLQTRWGVETILRSELFFSQANLRNRVSDPVSFLLMPLRALECWRWTPSTLFLSDWIGRMGLHLFYPANVGGWEGGRAWLSTRNVVARFNALAALLSGRMAASQRPLEISQFPDILTTVSESHELVHKASQLFFGESQIVPAQAIAAKAAPLDELDQLRTVILELFATPSGFTH